VAAEKMIDLIEPMRSEGNSVGGVIECVVRGVPPGLGEPVFDRLEADLAKAMLSLPATKGFEIGSGFGGTTMTGLEHNDEFYMDGKNVSAPAPIAAAASRAASATARRSFSASPSSPPPRFSASRKTVTEQGERHDLSARKAATIRACCRARCRWWRRWCISCCLGSVARRTRRSALRFQRE
jgi:chorismate synthase